MTFQPASFVSQFCFLVIVVAVLAAVIYGIWLARFNFKEPSKTAGKAIAAIVIWLLLSSVLVSSGFVESSPMPRLMAFFVMSNVAALILGFSKVGKAISLTIPIWILVLFQSFRLPLELVLHSWVQQGTIPETMTWTGYNFDIISGISALICAPLAKKYVEAAWLANIFGILLLLNVAKVAMLSSPLPFAWKLDIPLQLAFHLPYALIITVCVAVALAGHVALTRALIKR